MDGQVMLNGEAKTQTDSKKGQRQNDDADELLESYGCWSCHPTSLVCLASAPVFLLIMCMLIFSDAFNIGTLSGALTSLETRYELKASELGLIESLYEAGNLIFVIFVVHFAGQQKHRRPLWIGLGALTMAIGTLIAASPQFIFSAYEPYWRSLSTNQSTGPLTCRSDWLSGAEVDQCRTGDAEVHKFVNENRAAYVVVLCGEILVGIGWTPVMPLAMSYIDDNVNTKTSAMYIGIIQSMFGIGTIVGFLASAAVADIWVDFYRETPDAVQLTPDDRLWVGAWWLGLIMTSSLYFISSLPFLGFPRNLRTKPSSETKTDHFMLVEHSTTDLEENNVIDPRRTSTGLSSLISLPSSVWNLLRNPIFTLVNVASTSEMAVIAGLVTFLPKYLETQFGLSPPKANFFMAVVPVPAVALGSVLGGYLVKKFNLKAEGAMTLALVCSIIALIGQLALLGIGCDQTGLAGVDVAYTGDTSWDWSAGAVNLTSACNADCMCNPSDPEVVCGVDGKTYFSACHAGCHGNTNRTFSNCSCVMTTTNGETALPGSAQRGACAMGDCNMLAPFLVIMFIIALSASCEEIPQIMVLMRCVKRTDKSLSLGLKHVFSRIFGNIPAPLYYGLAIDSTCRLWQLFCGTQGECWAYSLPGFRYGFIGITVGLKVISAASTLVTLVVLKRRAGFKTLEGNHDNETGGERSEGDIDPRCTTMMEAQSGIKTLEGNHDNRTDGGERSEGAIDPRDTTMMEAQSGIKTLEGNHDNGTAGGESSEGAIDPRDGGTVWH